VLASSPCSLSILYLRELPSSIVLDESAFVDRDGRHEHGVYSIAMHHLVGAKGTIPGARRVVLFQGPDARARRGPLQRPSAVAVQILQIKGRGGGRGATASTPPLPRDYFLRDADALFRFLADSPRRTNSPEIMDAGGSRPPSGARAFLALLAFDALSAFRRLELLAGAAPDAGRNAPRLGSAGSARDEALLERSSASPTLSRRSRHRRRWRWGRWGKGGWWRGPLRNPVERGSEGAVDPPVAAGGLTTYRRRRSGRRPARILAGSRVETSLLW